MTLDQAVALFRAVYTRRPHLARSMRPEQLEEVIQAAAKAWVTR